MSYNVLRRVAANRSLTVYLTLGYPGPQETVVAAEELARLGVDMLELGIPYSNPKYDGPTVRRSHRIAISKGVGWLDAMEILEEISFERKFVLTYFDLANSLGVDRFFSKISETGVRAVLFPDLLIEYTERLSEYECYCKEYGLEPVYFVSSTFPHRLVVDIARREPSFIYMGLMASTGVSLPISAKRNIFVIKGLVNGAPLIGGFAIRGPEQVSEYIEAGINGVVIGSAVLSILGSSNNLGRLRAELADFINPILRVLKDS